MIESSRSLLVAMTMSEVVSWIVFLNDVWDRGDNRFLIKLMFVISAYTCRIPLAFCSNIEFIYHHRKHVEGDMVLIPIYE
jgi:hypothetical protein